MILVAKLILGVFSFGEHFTHCRYVAQINTPLLQLLGEAGSGSWRRCGGEEGKERKGRGEMVRKTRMCV
jgi:hypothetical protein